MCTLPVKEKAVKITRRVLTVLQVVCEATLITCYCYTSPRWTAFHDTFGLWWELRWPFVIHIIYVHNMPDWAFLRSLCCHGKGCDLLCVWSFLEPPTCLQSPLRYEAGVMTPVTDFRRVWAADICRCWHVLGSKIDAATAFLPSPGYTPAVPAAVVFLFCGIFIKSYKASYTC